MHAQRTPGISQTPATPGGGSQRLTPDIRTRTGSSRPAGRRLQRPPVSAHIKTPQRNNPSVKGQMAEVHTVHPGTLRWRESQGNAVTRPVWDSREDAAAGVRPKPRATPGSPELAAHPPAPLNPRKQANFLLQAEGEYSSHTVDKRFQGSSLTPKEPQGPGG